MEDEDKSFIYGIEIETVADDILAGRKNWEFNLRQSLMKLGTQIADELPGVSREERAMSLLTLSHVRALTSDTEIELGIRSPQAMPGDMDAKEYITFVPDPNAISGGGEDGGCVGA